MYSVAGFSRYIQFINVISVAGFSSAALINVLSVHVAGLAVQ
jgi:hypothetical protein